MRVTASNDMNKISIIKKIQLGDNSFPIQNLYSKLSFSFYCVNGRKNRLLYKGVKKKTKVLVLKKMRLFERF